MGLDDICAVALVLLHGLTKSGVGDHDFVAAVPVHADDVDLLGILAEELGEGLHAVGVPRLLEPRDDLADGLIVLLREAVGPDLR